MKDPTNILVATDLGVAGDQAIDTGLAWARRYNATLNVVHVVKDHSKRAEVTRTLVERIQSHGVTSGEVHLTEGKPADGILEIAGRTHADLVVLGGREATGARWLFGAVAERVVSHAKIPVLVARPDRAGPILATTDFSEPSMPAVRAAHDLARRTPAPIVIAHCLERASGMDALGMLTNPTGADSEMIEAARAQLQAVCDASRDHDTGRILVGDPAAAILSLSEELPASLIVLASHGRTGVTRLLVGSVAEKVAREAHCSVLVVRLKEPN